MKIHEYEITELIYRQFLGELSEEENNKLRHWIDSNPAHKQYYENLFTSYSLEKIKLLMSVDTEEAWKRWNRRSGRQKRFIRLWTKYAAIFILLIGVILVFYSRGYQEKELLPVAENITEGKIAAARAQILHNMSHDIRTPMNAIIGYADLASRHSDNPAKLKKYMENIQVCGQNLLMLLNNVLDLARIENDKTEMEYSVSDIDKDFRNCIAMFRNLADSKGQTLMVTTQLLHPYIYADIPHLTEVCTNLVSNAVKYTGAGGTIRCDVTQKPGEKESWCNMVITVADNGIGMSQEFQKHIFEPFERERTSTISKVEGSGIGMGIVKKLVGLMGGTVKVESRIGVGSTFTVTIPCRIASEDEIQAKRETGPSDQKSLCGVKILLAEDNDLNAEIAVELLQEEGCTVDRAKDGVECVDMLEKAANGTYQLILMDIQMPVMNGYDAAKKIRRMDDPQKADIPIIAMTANAFSEDKQAALDAGMNDHIAKPINMNVLVPTIQKYL